MTDTDQWNVEYYSHSTKGMSRAVLDIPSGIEVDEMMAFPGIDSITGESVRVRWEGGEWATAPEFEIAYLGVSCDAPAGCEWTLSGDFKVRGADDRPTRLGVILDHAVRNGWRVEGRDNPLTAKTYCPSHV